MIFLVPANKEEARDLVYISDKLGVEYMLISEEVHKFGNRYVNKLYEFFLLFFYVIKYRPSAILGAPSFKNRITSWVTRLKFYSYLRGLHPSSQHASSISDQIYFLFKRVGKDSKLINNYLADHCFVSSIITKKFLIERGVSADNISIVGPIWLNSTPRIAESSDNARVFFLTQSYKEHKLFIAAQEQTMIVGKVKDFCARENLSFTLKKHPRDTTLYPGINVFQGDATEFLSSLTKNDIVVSCFSTLAFEIEYLGGNVCYFVFSELEDTMNEAFIYSGVDFTNVSNVSDISNLKINSNNSMIFDKIDLTKFSDFLL